jgi:acyl-CoA synthetase (AMP-forming)/AMP-acid ligase II
MTIDTRPDYRGESLALIDYLDHWAAETPEREAAVDGSCRLSYAQLAERVEECARALGAVGVREGDRVAMLTTPRIEFLIVFLALSRIGAVWVGLNPRHTRAELQYVIADADCRMLIAIDSFQGRDYTEDIRALSAHQRLMSEPLVIVGEAPDPQFFSALAAAATPPQKSPARARAPAGARPSLIVYTSGSTGRPKGALLSDYGLISTYRRLAAYLAVGEMRLAAELPVDHVGGLDRAFLALIEGGLIVFLRRFDPRELLECIQRERITSWNGELTQWIKCAPLLDEYDLSSLEVIGYGGGPPPLALLERYAQVAPRIWTGYGMTETGDAVMLTDPHSSLEVLCEHHVGRPIDGVCTRLVSPEGKLLSSGEAGTLEVRSARLFLGYLGREQATADSFTEDGWFRTGDLLRERPDGSFDFLGRADHTYKSGGYNIYPREIVIALESHPAVAAAAVVSVPDDLYQSTGHAFVEPADGATAPSAEELFGHCSTSLARYKIPRSITVLQRLPTLRNEKIDRVRLREIALGRLEQSDGEELG